ncbi:transporter substrate-binding domain-containing protein [Agarivorans aestuarii]|uniref:Transporter substrate-binding domain-containing protein n=1 Tax=Agarivorans aestuarii TaxID=1563703 RepID=A0ABU7GAK2_9ALTE|nr:transporter substrate-binding domain-containing protein [Agarivorans aestuarii]MEE1676286.1 transporter substrate-binding domain-containing protein [Agarivorans aestuarii]
MLPSTTSFAQALLLVADRWCPFNCQANSAFPGYTIEIAQKVFAPEQPVRLLEMPWSRALRHTEKGVYHAVVGALADEAKGFVYPKVAIGKALQVLVMKSDTNWQYQGISSLEKLTIAVIADYDYSLEVDAYINAKQHRRNVVLVRSEHALERMHKLLMEGRIDGYIEDKSVVDYYVHQRGDSNAIRIATSFSIEPVYIAFSPANPQSPALAHRLSEGIQELRANGELAKILQRYGLSDWQ